MKIAIRYYTRSGNTEKLAKAIGEAVGVAAQDVSVALEEKADVLFLGSSVYAANVDKAVKEFLQENAEKIGTIVNFSTAAAAKSTYKRVKKVADAQGISMQEEEFFCRGAFMFMHRNRPNEQDLQNAAEFAKNVVKKLEEK